MLITQQLPVEQHRCVKQIQASIDLHQPNVVIALGQATGHPDISIERIAINLDDYPIKDNAGNQPIDETVIEGGENAYFSNLPIKAMVDAIRAKNLPARVSNSAGTYVCNHLFYGLMHHTIGKEIQAGFIHIPLIPEQVINKPLPTLLLTEISQALTAAIRCAVKLEKDIKQIGGQVA